MREIITQYQIDEEIGRLKRKLLSRLAEKGYGTMASSHEILGIIQEEMHELVDAVRANNNQQIIDELLDIAVACIFSMACIQNGKTDW